jgi:hypothetical protein
MKEINFLYDLYTEVSKLKHTYLFLDNTIFNIILEYESDLNKIKKELKDRVVRLPDDYKESSFVEKLKYWENLCYTSKIPNTSTIKIINQIRYLLYKYGD